MTSPSSPVPTAQINAEDLKAVLSEKVYLEIFDDDNDGEVSDDDQGVALVIERAHAEAVSYLPRVYDTFPASVAPLLKSAELDFAVALAYERHPEYVRAGSEESRDKRWMRGERKMENVADAIQWIVEGAPENQPQLAGGRVFTGTARPTIVDSPNGDPNMGDF